MTKEERFEYLRTCVEKDEEEHTLALDAIYELELESIRLLNKIKVLTLQVNTLTVKNHEMSDYSESLEAEIDALKEKVQKLEKALIANITVKISSMEV